MLTQSIASFCNDLLNSFCNQGRSTSKESGGQDLAGRKLVESQLKQLIQELDNLIPYLHLAISSVSLLPSSKSCANANVLGLPWSQSVTAPNSIADTYLDLQSSFSKLTAVHGLIMFALCCLSRTKP